MGTIAAPRKFRFLCVVASLVLLMNGCSRDSLSGRNAECRLTHFEVLRAIADDAEIRHYAAAHFESRETTFLWDRMPTKVQECGTSRSGIKFVRSSSPGFDPHHDFIAIEKMYFDEDAAFVEIGFPPTGKNSDVFLRKVAGKWVVVEKYLWES